MATGPGGDQLSVAGEALRDPVQFPRAGCQIPHHPQHGGHQVLQHQQGKCSFSACAGRDSGGFDNEIKKKMDALSLLSFMIMFLYVWSELKIEKFGTHTKFHIEKSTT